MKRLLLLLCTAALGTAVGFAQTVPVLTISQVQRVAVDSLKKADAAGLTAHTTLDDSPYTNDTVAVWGVVMSKVRISQGGPLMIPSLGNGYSFFIAETLATGGWRGMHIRASDTTAAVTSLVSILDTGMVVKVTGRVTEFGPSVRTGVPANNFSSTTQFEMDLDPTSGTNFIPVEINPLPIKRRPTATVVKISDLFKGQTPQFETGEQWEGCYIEVQNVTVVQSTVSNNRMTVVVEDATGNRLTVLDDSYYYRMDLSGYQPPAQGARLQYVRGFINNRYGIAPMFANDMRIASFPPTVPSGTVRRTPIIPKSTDGVTVTCKVFDTNAGGTVTKVDLYYGVNGGTLQKMAMTLATADSAVGTIPSQPVGTNVRYMILATDNDNETGRAPNDTTRELYSYKVIDGAVTIRDIQYTPFRSGNTPYTGAVVALRGIVTSDTSNLGANFITIQDGVQPWSGIVIDATKDIVKALTTGDDVTITGTVGESFSVTRLANITDVVKSGPGTAPQPIARQTGEFKTNPGGVLDGEPNAEQWESMLVKFNTITVTTQNVDGAAGNFGEFGVTDGSGDMRVDDIGTWKRTYSTGLASHTGSTLLVVGTKIQSLTGIMYFGFSNYKLEPRGASDFQNVQVSVQRLDDTPTRFSLEQSYPNPLSIANGYQSTIRFSLASAAHTQLAVFDALGRMVDVVVAGEQEAGTYHADYDASRLTAGVYFFRLTTASGSITKRFSVVR